MASNNSDGRYDVYWPRGARQVQMKPLAKRLEGLEGKTVAQVWNYLYRGNEIFSWLEEGLKARLPGVRFVNWREFGNTHGHDEREVVAALPARFEELGVDAA